MKKSQLMLSATVFGGIIAFTACNSPTVGGNNGEVPAPMTTPVATAATDLTPLNTAPVAGPQVTSYAPLTGNETTEVAYGNVQAKPVSAIPAFHMNTPAVAPTVYTVKKGDSLWSIGHTYGVTAEEVATANNLSSKKMLQVGQKITIPAGGAYLPPEKRKKIVVQTPKSTTTKTKVTHSTGTVAATATTATAAGTYTVVSGDFPEKIARKHKVTTKALLEANKLTEKSILQIGQKLVIPGKVAVAGTTTTTTEGTTTTTTATGTPSDTTPPVVNPVGGTATTPVVTDPVGGPSLGDTVDAEAGETLKSMAEIFFVPVETMMKLNPGIDPNTPLKAGQQVRVPPASF